MNTWDMSGMAAFVVEKYMTHIQWMREALESAVIFTTFTIFTIQLHSEIRAETDFVKSFYFQFPFKQLDPLFNENL